MRGVVIYSPIHIPSDNYSYMWSLRIEPPPKLDF